METFKTGNHPYSRTPSYKDSRSHWAGTGCGSHPASVWWAWWGMRRRQAAGTTSCRWCSSCVPAPPACCQSEQTPDSPAHQSSPAAVSGGCHTHPGSAASCTPEKHILCIHCWLNHTDRDLCTLKLSPAAMHFGFLCNFIPHFFQRGHHSCGIYIY